MKNSFKELERLEIEGRTAPLKRIQNNITSNLSLFKFIGNIMELFFPRMVDLIVRLAGGKDSPDTPSKPKPSKYPNQQ